MKAQDYEYIKELVLGLIPKGKDNRKPMSYFVQRTGLTRRDITQVLLELRKDYPICTTRSSPGGYWLGSTEDILETVGMLTTTRNTIDQSINRLIKQVHWS